ncbi:MAG TPA: redoxin domain-containing protein [Anaerolineales bacterium]|nr:redoxin domain-containing protein [Anaerolineales bacterium]
MDPIVPTGNLAPQFQLPDLQGNNHSLNDMQGRIVVLTFWSAECTWCERVDRALMPYLDRWKESVAIWWIASNANESRLFIEQVAAERDLPVVLMDRYQVVADLYGAETTPHFFIVDKLGKLAYQGAWDDVTFRQRVANRVYVPKVIKALLENHVPSIGETPPYGCVLVRSFEPDS